MNPHRTLAAVALAVYGTAVVITLMWPAPIDSAASEPLTAALVWLREHRLGWVTYSVVEFSANIALFVPIGLLVTLVSRRLRWWHVVGGAALVASAAEVAQAVLRPERFGTIQDVVANTLGAGIGFVVAHAVRTAHDGSSEPPLSSG